MTWYAIHPDTVDSGYRDFGGQSAIPYEDIYIRKIGDTYALYEYVDDITSDDDVDYWIDEEGTIEILGMSYNPSFILKQIDPIMWSMARDDYVTFAVQDIKYAQPPRPKTWSEAIIWSGIFWDDDNVDC